MSAATCTGRSPAARASAPRTPAAPGSRCRTAAAAPAAAPRAPARPPRGAPAIAASHARPSASGSSGACRATNAASPRAITSTVYSPAIGSMSLPCSGVVDVARGAGSRAISCSMNSGWPSSTTSTARLPRAERRDLVGHQRIGDVEHERSARSARRTRRPGRAAAARGSASCRGPPCTMMPTSSRVPREALVQPVLDDVAARRREALVALQLLVRGTSTADATAGRSRTRAGSSIRCRVDTARRDVVLADEAAAHVAGADAQLQHRRHVRRLRQRERVLDHAHHVRELGPRVEQQQRRLERVGVACAPGSRSRLRRSPRRRRSARRRSRRATRGSTARRRRRWCRRSTSTSPRRAADSGSTRPASPRPTPRSSRPRRARRARPGSPSPAPARRAGATPARPGSRRRRRRPTAAAPW